eukprot:NODE_244_length_11882_cov_0.560214.p7 type:complete len:224 gc:universal NODE_244_length_11882_cov_0.560214:5728-5057(-)
MVCERPKGKRILILSAREQYLPTLNYNDLDAFAGFGQRSLWSKMSTKGIFLTCSPRKLADEMFGMKAYQLFGKCLLDFVHDDDYEKMRYGLTGVLEGKICYLFHRIRYKSDYRWVESIFFPGGYHYPVKTTQVLPGRAPTVIMPRPEQPCVAYLFHKLTILRETPSNTDPQFFATRYENPEQDEVFSAFNPNRETSWQYELHMLKSEHKHILETIGMKGPILE